MSWESSLEYYKLLNLGVKQRLGGLHSAHTVMSSVEFDELTELQRAGRWDDVAALLADAARGVEAAGADLLLMCTTSFHMVADQVEAAVDIPLLHLGDVVADACKARGLSSIGLIGTAFTMQPPFFIDRIASHGLEVVVPDERPTRPSTGSSTASSCTARCSTPAAPPSSASSTSSGTPAPRA